MAYQADWVAIADQGAIAEHGIMEAMVVQGAQEAMVGKGAQEVMVDQPLEGTFEVQALVSAWLEKAAAGGFDFVEAGKLD